MSTPFATAVRAGLEHVARLRKAQARDPLLAARVAAVKRFQHARLAGDYARLALQPRYRAATSFFLDDLYGPGDFADRDAEFGRIVPAISRLLPTGMLDAIRKLIELHALSEELDQQMAQAMHADALDDDSYRAAWLAVGRTAERERQLAMLLDIGRELDRHARRPALARMLRAMRGPARLAGLARLQGFLERGLTAFAAMGGASEFLAAIKSNEQRVIDQMSKREKPDR